MSDTRQHVLELLKRLTPTELEDVEKYIECKLDPISRKLAGAPLDDEPVTEEERQRIAQAEEWLKHNKAIPMEDVLAEFGLTIEDFEKMGRTPLPRGKKN